MPPFSVRLTIFVVVAVVVSALTLFIMFYGPVKRWLYKHFTVRMYYKTVRRVTYDNDYLLINDFRNKVGSKENFTIDHLMAGDKYFYVIRDRYYPGAISAKEDDAKWLYYKGKKKQIINNPMMLNRLRVEHLALLSNVDVKYFISIVLVNDDCLMTPMDCTCNDSFLVSLKKFPKLIKIIESSSDVEPLQKESVAAAMKDFAKLNLNH